MSSRTVTALANTTVKAVRALHLRKARDETGLFVAEGLKNVTEGVELGHAPRILMYGRDADHPLLKQAIATTLAAEGEVIEVTQDIAYGRAMRFRALPMADLLQGFALPPDEAIEDMFFGAEAAPPPGDYGPGLDQRKEIPYTRQSVTEEVRELETLARRERATRHALLAHHGDLWAELARAGGVSLGIDPPPPVAIDRDHPRIRGVADLAPALATCGTAGMVVR